MHEPLWGAKIRNLAPLLVLAYMAFMLLTACGGVSNAILVTQVGGSVIAIDPGHGGYDPGAITSQGLYEKNINLVIAQKVKTQLENTGAKVILTREDDRDYVADGARGKKKRKQTDLDYRLGLIEQANAKILVSIHVNAVSSGTKSGAETFYQKGAEQGKVLAEYIQNELRQVPTMNKRIAKPGEFYLTRKTKTPAVIVELGYLSNPSERVKLQQFWYQDELAKAIARGIARYLAST
ncbi:MAG: N-acetylmuramoyl-L-alanine amidase [Peptococcaceae bacterium]|nr:N-acetylmuramoyl-L-alanine amidase [Peptococcaceae bacterium]